MRSRVEMSERQEANDYEAEFKGSAVKLAEEAGNPLAQTAWEMGVSMDSQHGGVRQLQGKLQPGWEPLIPEHLCTKLKRLRRDVSNLDEALDIRCSRPSEPSANSSAHAIPG